MKKQTPVINLLVYLLFIFFSLAQLTRISFLGQQINGYFYEFFLAILVLYFLIKKKFQPIIKGYQENRFLFWFFIFTFFSFFINWQRFSSQENMISILYQLRLIGYFIFFFCIKDYRLKLPLNLFIWLTALGSIIQYILYSDLRNLLYLGWDPHLYRLFGLFFDTSTAVSIYGLVFFYLLSQKRELSNKILLFAYFVFMILTFSRIGYFAFIVTIILFYLKKDVRKVLIILMLMIGLLIIVPKPFGEGINLTRIFSIKSRFVDYRLAINSWKYSPIYGIGYNRIRYFKKQFNLIDEKEFNLTHSGASYHSSFLIVLVTTGIIGLGLFIIGLIKLLGSSNYGQFFAVYIGIISLADNSLLHPFILLLLLLLISLSRKKR